MASTIGTALGSTDPVITGISNSAYAQVTLTFAGIEGTFTLKELLDYYNDQIKTLQDRVTALEA